MKVVQFILILFLLSGYTSAQDDSLAYAMHKNRLVVHTSLSIRDAPFNFKDNFGELDKLTYRANLNVINGIGVAYKCFAIHIKYKRPGHIRNTETSDQTTYFDLGSQFSLKNWYF